MIRDAEAREHPAIRAIVTHAFGRAEEANLVEQLRADSAVLFELVAGDNAALRGHVLYSRLNIERDGESVLAAALAPVAVLPAFQRQGLGGALIEAGNARCAEIGLKAILVLGHREYYPRFGFTAAAAQALDAQFSGPSFMALELETGSLSRGGRVRYARAFGV